MLDKDLDVSVSGYVVWRMSTCVMKLTSGWPLGSTLGPCREWQGTMSTSGGRCASNAAISGALHEVCPPTMAFIFVAVTW